MKITVTETPTGKQPGYPYLGKEPDGGSGLGIIVLFTAKRTGVVVHADVAFPVGYYSESWRPECFKRFNGTVVLEN